MPTAPQPTQSIAQEFSELETGDRLVCTTRAGGTERYEVLSVTKSADWECPLVQLAFEGTDQKLEYFVTYREHRLIGVYGRQPAGALWWVVDLQIERH